MRGVIVHPFDIRIGLFLQESMIFSLKRWVLLSAEIITLKISLYSWGLFSPRKSWCFQSIKCVILWWLIFEVPPRPVGMETLWILTQTRITKHQPLFLGSEFHNLPLPFVFQIGACGYIEKLVQNSCWLIQAFSLACTVKGYKMRKYAKQIWKWKDREGRTDVLF